MLQDEPTQHIFKPGDRVQTNTGAEGIVTERGAQNSKVLVTSAADVIRTRTIHNGHLKPVDQWREALVYGDVVEFRIMRGWYHCHVHTVSDTELELAPVLSHTLFKVPKCSVRIKRCHLIFPLWNIRVYPSHVKCAEILYSCYGVTRDHYIVDTRAGRAYFPKRDCTPVHVAQNDPIHIGTLTEDAIVPKEVACQLDPETLLDLMRQSTHTTNARGLITLMQSQHAYHTYRHWTAGSIAHQLDMIMQINDPVAIQELLDIAGSYHIANRSQRLEQALRARRLVRVEAKAGQSIRIKLFWTGIAPRPHTMLDAREVFRSLETSSRPTVDTLNPYGPHLDHTFLHPYQTRTVRNMHRLEDMNIAELFTYKLNGHNCNDYTGIASPVYQQGGGFLSADVGLGKTVMMCALMLSRPMPTLVVVPPTLIDHWEQTCKLYGIFVSVCHGKRDLPTATARQARKLSKRLHSGKICANLIHKLTQLYTIDRSFTMCKSLVRVRLKHGKCHRRALAASARHCIITTPGILRRKWHKFIFTSRIVVDEAHQYKNAKTATVRAMHSICPRMMWCITATPQTAIQQAQILNIYPGGQIQNLSPTDAAQMKRITLRLSRKELEDTGQLNKIDVSEEIILCAPTSVYASRHDQYNAMLQSDAPLNNRDIRIMREDLERMCVHTSCVPLYRYGSRIDVDTATFDNITKMFDFGNKDQQRVKETIANLDTCALCLEQYERPTITSCGHVYCRECVTQLQKHTNKCPQCRQPIQQFVEMVDTSDDINRVTHLGQVYRVPNITAEEGEKVRKIEHILKQGPTVVCSKYTSVVRYLAKRFNLPAITGKSTQAARVKALETFRKDGALFITEKSAGVGLCLQRAHHLVFVEHNMKNREQVIGRIKRIGQTHPIKLWTLVCKGTTDEYGHTTLRI